MDDMDRIPDSEDLSEAMRVRKAASELEKQGEDPSVLHAQADAMVLRIARYLVARELPGVEFPPQPETEDMGYLCGGLGDTRSLCQQLVFLYAKASDPSGWNRFLIDDALMRLDIFCRALSPRAHVSATATHSDAG